MIRVAPAEAEKPHSSEIQVKVVNALRRSSGASDRTMSARKSLINLHRFTQDVSRWQKDRPPLFETNKNLGVLISLLLGEIEEVLKHRELEGLEGYNPKLEEKEMVDVAFFLSSINVWVARLLGGDINPQMALKEANGQASGSDIIEILREASGNLGKKTVEKDLQYLWTLWISYLIHMKYPVNPNQVLREDIIPKNNGNYPRELLRGNPIFERTFNRKMNPDEMVAYYDHFRKAMRLIRDFIIKYVDPNVEHTGLKPEHYRQYEIFIYSFMNFNSVGLNPQKALEMLESQLYSDFKIVRTPQNPVILRPNYRLSN